MREKIVIVAILFGMVYFMQQTMEYLYPKEIKPKVVDSTETNIDTTQIDTLLIDTTTVQYEQKIIANEPRKFSKVPAGVNVYRSAQPRIDELTSILENYPIDVVIRMNDIEGTGVSIDAERLAVESMGKKFVWVNAHLGFKEGQGYTESLEQIQPYLDSGNVLIHCTAGKDRTGYQVARFIQRQKGWSREKLWNYTIEHNDWELHICQGKKGYIRYMEAFYPYVEWRKQNHCK